jgi:transcriptional regulator with XRE-family HTH domain
LSEQCTSPFVAKEGKDRTLEELFGQEVTRRREKLGLTQEELAFRAGLGTNTIQKYEAGEREPRAKALVKLASALETSPTELLSHSSWVQPAIGRTGYLEHRTGETETDEGI